MDIVIDKVSNTVIVYKQGNSDKRSGSSNVSYGLNFKINQTILICLIRAQPQSGGSPIVIRLSVCPCIRPSVHPAKIVSASELCLPFHLGP